MLRCWISTRATPAPTAPEPAEADACAYGAQMLAEAREEVNRADAKAQVLLGIVGIGLGAVAGGLLAGSWSPFALSDTVEWLWWAGMGAALAAVIALAAAVYPRTERTAIIGSGTVMYFADVLRFESTEAVSEALLRSSALDLARVSDQIRQISKILSRKYRLIRAGFWLLFAGIAAALGAVVLDLVL